MSSSLWTSCCRRRLVVNRTLVVGALGKNRQHIHCYCYSPCPCRTPRNTFSTSSSSSREGGELISKYNFMTSNGDIKEDVHQVKALLELDRLRHDLCSYDPPAITKTTTTIQKEPSTSKSSRLFGGWLQQPFGGGDKKDKTTTTTDDDTTFTPVKGQPKGVYLHGGVGCGKTFCMNLFYDSIQGSPWEQDKQKIHYHKFMLGIHQQMHEAKMLEGLDGDVILPRVVERTLQRGRLICLDEFQVTDVADAVILKRLFTSLLQEGGVLVATSNRPPQDLYLNGLQRNLFLPFIDFLQERLVIVSMWDSNVDYRLVQAATNKAEGVYFVGEKQKRDFDKVFYKLTDNNPVTSTLLTTQQGRHVAVPMACLEKSVARFTFEDVCKKALGAADYLVIGQHFHTVFVENIPKLSRNELNWVRRFIVFVDAMYECHVKLILQAATGPNEIFGVHLGDQYNDEVFAFDRTRSRLQEMSSNAYLTKQHWTRNDAATQNTKPQDVVKVELMVESIADVKEG